MLLHFPSQTRRYTPFGTRPNLLIIAFDCTLGQGTAGSLGWTRVLEAAREFEVHAIVGPESFAWIKRHAHDHRVPSSVHFHAVRQDRLHAVLLRLGDRNSRGCLVYRRWHWLAFEKAQELHATHDFALVHQINVREFSEPGYAAHLGIPFVWGPASGPELLPREFLTGLSPRDQISERAREIGIRLSLRSGRVRQAASRASTLLASSTSARSEFERAFRRPVELLPEAGVHAVRRPDLGRFRSNGPLNLLWAGRFTRPNALPLLLEAVANLGHDVDYRLNVIGAGPLEAEWKALANEMGVRRRCIFLGDLDLAGLQVQLAWAHLFVHTSLRNAPITPVLESLAHGVPVMCLDHHSAGDIVTAQCGIKVPVTHPGHAVATMASTIRSLAQDRTPMLQLSAGACDRAQGYLWRENTAKLMHLYRGIARIAHRTAS